MPPYSRQAEKEKRMIETIVVFFRLERGELFVKAGLYGNGQTATEKHNTLLDRQSFPVICYNPMYYEIPLCNNGTGSWLKFVPEQKGNNSFLLTLW